MQHEGRGVVRLNDKTSHGGHVISATGPTIMGLPAALVGDMTHCPKCKGDFAITPAGVGARHLGRAYAYDKDVSACGAQLMTTVC